jgi:hypothetical protein
LNEKVRASIAFSNFVLRLDIFPILRAITIATSRSSTRTKQVCLTLRCFGRDLRVSLCFADHLTVYRLRLSIAILTLCFGACSDQETHSSRLGKEARANGANCVGVGATYCDIAPVDDLAERACAHLRWVLEGRQIGDQMIRQVVACETPVVSTSSRFAAAAIATRLDSDGPPLHGAFLFVRFEKGWYLVDHLLDPAWNHGGYCRTRFELQWGEKSNKSKVNLDALSERICHMPLDQKEIAAGESDIATSECRKAQYELTARKVIKLSKTESDGPCRFR